MRVLVINDEDGHCQVYDMTTDEQRTKIYCQMAKYFTRHGTENWNAKQIRDMYGDQFLAAVNAKDVDAILELFENIDIHFDRSGGGRYYEEEVYSDFGER